MGSEIIMNDRYQFTLSEEITRQAVEVSFKIDGRWNIAFSNPTAGPWKIIKLGNYEFGNDLRYAKEEDRPDLILYTPIEYIFFVLEAKDSLRKLFTNIQLTKSVYVFQKEVNRILDVINDPDLTIRAFGQQPQNYKIIPGYIIGSTTEKTKKDDLTRLINSHIRLAQQINNKGIEPCVCFIVQKEGDDLTIKFTSFGLSDKLQSTIENYLPKDIQVLL
jgi:hypothetical protein